MVSIKAFYVVDMQRHSSMVHKALEKFPEQLRIHTANGIAGELDIHIKAGAAGEINHYPRERLIQRHISVAVAVDAALIANGLVECLAQGDAQIFNGVVVVDMQVAFG